ncbi:MAG: hypothetical protein MI799_12625 [Desulfobacterales bacterium]|nr:hypothetical protein [Desulfobacterales bacterium]
MNQANRVPDTAGTPGSVRHPEIPSAPAVVAGSEERLRHTISRHTGGSRFHNRYDYNGLTME